jgi:hypothetical protein
VKIGDTFELADNSGSVVVESVHDHNSFWCRLHRKDDRHSGQLFIYTTNLEYAGSMHWAKPGLKQPIEGELEW